MGPFWPSLPLMVSAAKETEKSLDIKLTSAELHADPQSGQPFRILLLLLNQLSLILIRYIWIWSLHSKKGFQKQQTVLLNEAVSLQDGSLTFLSWYSCLSVVPAHIIYIYQDWSVWPTEYSTSDSVSFSGLCTLPPCFLLGYSLWETSYPVLGTSKWPYGNIQMIRNSGPLPTANMALPVIWSAFSSPSQAFWRQKPSPTP